jgi:hypothetical protein
MELRSVVFGHWSGLTGVVARMVTATVGSVEGLGDVFKS